MKTGVVYAKAFSANGWRVDSSFHLSDSNVLYSLLDSCPYKQSTIDGIKKDCFFGNIFTRVFVKDAEHGVPYMTASDMVKAEPLSGRFLSKKQVASLSNLILHKNWILISCSGTIGNVVYTNEQFDEVVATHDLIRLLPDETKTKGGVLYAYLASRYGYIMLTQSRFGGVVKHINPSHVSQIPIPKFPAEFQNKIDAQIKEAAALRVEANKLLEEAKTLLIKEAGLRELTPEDYDYYGPRVSGRKVSCFVRNKKDIDTTTINAFNHSERIRKTKASMPCQTVPLKDVLLGGDTFSSYSVPSIEVKPEHGIMFINQKDIFDNIVKGKWVSKRNVSLDKLVEYGEVIVACDGTLGESELFCRTLFANEDLQGALISTHFIRMKTNEFVPSGYLYAWLSSDYGFRFIRNCQAGTKLCHPIPKMFLQIPVPILAKEIMNAIDEKVRNAHTLRYKANCLERSAIEAVEKEIDSWSK